MSDQGFKVNEEILFKYLTDSLSDEETQAVLDWMSRSDENKSYVEQLKKLWSKGQSFSLFDESDLT